VHACGGIDQYALASCTAAREIRRAKAADLLPKNLVQGKS